MDGLVLAFVLAFSLSATYTDFKRREIPDLLNYGGLAVGLGLDFLSFSQPFFLSSVMPFVVGAFLFAYLLYRLGVWAGGDVKFFTALCAFYPLLQTHFSLLSLFWIFLGSVLALVPVALFLYAPRLVPYSKEFRRMAFAAFRSGLNTALISYDFLFVLGFLAFFFSASPLLQLVVVGLFYFLEIPFLPSLVLFAVFSLMEGLDLPLFLFLLAAAFGLRFLPSAFSLVSEKILRRRVPAAHLQEGMIPAQTVSIEGRKIRLLQPVALSQALPKALRMLRSGASASQTLSALSGLPGKGRVLASALRARGLVPSEIKALKAAGVKHLVVRESLPYAPLLAAGFLLAVVSGL